MMLDGLTGVGGRDEVNTISETSLVLSSIYTRVCCVSDSIFHASFN